jgi:signal transduction histidine kinase
MQQNRFRKILLWIVFAIFGPLLIVSGSALAQGASSGTLVYDAVFYSAFATLLFSFFLVNFALKNRVGVLYSVLFCLSLGLVWILEGGLTNLWPSLGEVDIKRLSYGMGFFTAAFGLYTAEQAIDARLDMGLVRKAMHWLSGGALLLMVLSLLWPSALMALLANIMLIAMFASHAISTASWRTHSEKRQAAPFIITLLLLAATGLILVWFFIVGLNGPVSKSTLLRTLYGLTVLPSMVAIVLALIDMRQSREAALENMLAMVQKEAKTAEALLEMEKNYAAAREIAASRSRNMKSFSHDFGQPIASMRAELEELKSEMGDESFGRLKQGLDYFSALIDELSLTATKDGVVKEETAGLAEEISAQMLLSLLDKMFMADARSRNIELRLIASDKIFLAPAVSLIRIASNLVANALAHSGAGKIIVGVRKQQNKLRLIIADNGKGLEDSVSGDYFAEGVKADSSGGSGMGLSIVKQTAQICDFELRVKTEKGRGTYFCVAIPAL